VATPTLASVGSGSDTRRWAAIASASGSARVNSGRTEAPTPGSKQS